MESGGRFSHVGKDKPAGMKGESRLNTIKRGPKLNLLVYLILTPQFIYIYLFIYEYAFIHIQFIFIQYIYIYIPKGKLFISQLLRPSTSGFTHDYTLSQTGTAEKWAWGLRENIW